MPRDQKGNFHINTQRAMRADGMGHGSKPKNATAIDSAGDESASAEHDHESAEGGSHIAIHSHGDGTYHTETHDGEREEHPTLGHALMHAAHHHEPDGKHAHVKHDGVSMQSHHAGEDGNVEGPHDHENIEALKDHLGRFFDEEENEYTDHQHQEHGAGEPGEYA